MKTNRTRWMALSAALLMSLPFVARSQNQIPAAINYQGHLTDTLGDPLPSGYYEIEFRIWDDTVATNAGDLVWARSFPLHVVTNGLFYVLLTDAGGQVTTPTTTTNTLLDAFGGPRWLGLTITVSNGVNISDLEIKPRQQLASAPFAIQAQQVYEVGASGVSTSSLQNGAVTTAKIVPGNVTSDSLATKAVTTDKIADLAVTTTQIPNSAVTTPKIGDKAVTTEKITALAVTTTQITNGTVKAGNFVDSAVTTPKIANNAVMRDQIADGAVTAAKLASPNNPANVALLNADQTFTGTNSFTGPASFTSSASPVLYVNNKGGANQAAKFELSGANVIIRSATITSGGIAAVIENTGPNNGVIALNPSGGRVGIGTINPVNALVDIIGSVSRDTGSYGWLTVNGHHGTSSGQTQPYSLYTEKRMAASQFDAHSDARIKHIIGRSDSLKDLETLLGIQITDYSMVDTHQYGNHRFKKVIAQQVEQVYPQVVTTNLTQVVPDIYVRSEARDGWIPLTKRPKPALRAGDEVRLILESGTKLYEVKEANAGGFRVSSSVNGPVFVYGRQVHDFHVVDYDGLTALNISATQELYHRLVQSEQEAARLKVQNQDLQARMARLQAHYQKRQARFTALEQRVHESLSGMQQVSLHQASSRSGMTDLFPPPNPTARP